MNASRGIPLLVTLALLAGCSVDDTPSPTATLVEAVPIQGMDVATEGGYAKAVCADLDHVAKTAPVTSSELAVEALTLVQSHRFPTVDDAKALANGAVTYICPKYEAARLP